jgi:hypothetical protein
MKKSIFALSALVLLTAGFLSGCESPPQPVPPAVLFGQFCTAGETINEIILTTPGVSAQAVKNITEAKPILDKVCASGVTLTATNLQDVVDNAVPLLSLVVEALPPTTPNIDAIKLAVALAPGIIAQVKATLPVTAKS